VTDHTARGVPDVPSHNILPDGDSDEMPDPVPAEIRAGMWYVVARGSATAMLTVVHECSEQMDAVSMAEGHPGRDVVAGDQLRDRDEPVRWIVGDGPEVVL